jgi:hypothetical protein
MQAVTAEFSGYAGRVARRSRIDSDRLPLTASPARIALPKAHFDRNNIPAISGTGH